MKRTLTKIVLPSKLKLTNWSISRRGGGVIVFRTGFSSWLFLSNIQIYYDYKKVKLKNFYRGKHLVGTSLNPIYYELLTNGIIIKIFRHS